eukprot:2123122-Lingulodinium_polyedra.AAC.1
MRAPSRGPVHAAKAGRVPDGMGSGPLRAGFPKEEDARHEGTSSGLAQDQHLLRRLAIASARRVP